MGDDTYTALGALVLIGKNRKMLAEGEEANSPLYRAMIDKLSKENILIFGRKTYDKILNPIDYLTKYGKTIQLSLDLNFTHKIILSTQKEYEESKYLSTARCIRDAAELTLYTGKRFRLYGKEACLLAGPDLIAQFARRGLIDGLFVIYDRSRDGSIPINWSKYRPCVYNSIYRDSYGYRVENGWFIRKKSLCYSSGLTRVYLPKHCHHRTKKRKKDKCVS